MPPKLTLKHVAKVAGVSEMTASRALRNAKEISSATREKVKTAAAELGYVPNQIAGALSSNKVNLVGIIIPSVKSYIFSEVLDGISATLEQSLLRPVFGITNYDLKTEERVIHDMLAWRPSGLIIAGLEHTQAARRLLKNSNTPVVEIMDTDGDPVFDCVGISHYRAGFDMGETIVKRGYRHIGFLGTKMSLDFRASKRLQGFKDALSSNNITLRDQEHYPQGSSLQNGKTLTANILTRQPNLDCIYCSTDIIAMGAVIYCMEQNISIPDDIAIAGFNNLTITHGLPVQLATTDSMRFDIGQKAAQLILAHHENKNITMAKNIIQFKPKVIIGNSISFRNKDKTVE